MVPRVNGVRTVDLLREFEVSHVEQGSEIQIGILCSEGFCYPIKTSYFFLKLVQFFRSGQIDFVEQDGVCECQLLAHLSGVVNVIPDVFGINHGYNSMECEFTADPLIHEECLGDGRWVGQPCCFDYERVEF